MSHPILFIVIKEYEPADPTTYSDLAPVDNTIRVVYRDYGDDCYQYDVYVRRPDGKTFTTVPYSVIAYTERELVSFVRFICHVDARLLIDVYHGESCPPGQDAHEWLKQYETESRSVIGFQKKPVGKPAFRLLKETLRQMKKVYPFIDNRTI